MCLFGAGGKSLTRACVNTSSHFLLYRAWDHKKMILETNRLVTLEANIHPELDERNLSPWPVASGRRQQGGPSLFHPDTKKLHFVLTSSVPYALRKPFSLQRKEKNANFKVCCGFIYPQINVVIALNLPFCFKLLEH